VKVHLTPLRRMRADLRGGLASARAVLLGGFFAAFVVLAPAVASAEPAGEGNGPTATSHAAAEALFTEGRALLDAGHYAEACVKLAESQRLDPSAGTLLNLGECFEKNGQTASAWATFKDAERASVDRHRPDWEKTAQRRAATLEGRLSRVTVVVPAPARVDGLVIEIGELRVEPALYDTPIPLDPGPHVVHARAPGRVPWGSEISIASESDRRSITVPVLAIEVLAPPAGAKAAPDPDANGPGLARRSGGIPVVAWALGAGAVVLAGVGVTLWVSGQNDRSDLSRTCAATGTCAHDDIVASRTKLIAGDVLVGAGIVALGAGLYFALTGRPGAARIALYPQGFVATAPF
jgi:hypothetical protein